MDDRAAFQHHDDLIDEILGDEAIRGRGIQLPVERGLETTDLEWL